MTFEEVILKIKLLAIQNGVEPSSSPLLDNDTLIELILPRVIDVVVMDVCKDENQLNALRQNHTIAFALGVGALPVAIKEEFAETIYFVDGLNQNTGALVSYKRDLIDFGQQDSPILDTFCLQSGNIYYRIAGQTASSFTGNQTINAVTIPTLPTTSGGTVNIKANILEQIIAFTVGIITGQIPLAKIGLDYTGFGMEGKEAA